MANLARVMAASLGLSSLVAAQTFTGNSADIPAVIPFDTAQTEQVDFADVDLDGDWDAVFADGSDSGQDQNRLWINSGGLQGGDVGVFVDETELRMPPVLDQSRDVELADIDDDGDLDLYVANTASIVLQSDRIQINVGFAQAGTLGYFVDETASRWIGLGGPGSSLAPLQPLPDGGFYDWTSDGEFADLDNDGDLDLFKSTVGPGHNGNVPSRIFLNDGDGFFEEFNPAGTQLASVNLAAGTPAIWAEGVQENNTTDSSGAFADIAAVAVDSDVVDVDGDFDLDVLLGNREADPRLFTNRLAEDSFVFRDSTLELLGTEHAQGGQHYEQEFGDLDNDGDVDLYGLNYKGGSFVTGFEDRVLENDGSGSFGNGVVLEASTPDDEEADFVDFDNDGDLDVIVGNFSGSDRLYRNDLAGGEYELVFQEFLPPNQSNAVARDVEVADVDADGDYDAFIANGTNGGGFPGTNRYYENLTEVTDVHAPYVPSLEPMEDVPAQKRGYAVRAQVYDNAPYYITWYNPTVLEVSVDGLSIGDVDMKSSGGQVFRGELPGNLVGDVTYRVRSSDEYANTGFSELESYVATGNTGSSVGDFTSASLGEPIFRALSQAFAGLVHHFAVEGLAPGAPGFIAFARSTMPPLDLGNGVILNLAPPLLVTIPVVAGADGTAVVSVVIPPGTQGDTFAGQLLAFDGAFGADWASSRALVFGIQ